MWFYAIKLYVEENMMKENNYTWDIINKVVNLLNEQDSNCIEIPNITWYRTRNKKELFDHVISICAVNYEEKGFMFDIAKDGEGEGVILEIGADIGQSAIPLAMGSKMSNRDKVISIDHDKGGQDYFWERDKRLHSKRHGGRRWEIFIENLALCGVEDWVIPIGADSKEAWKYLDVDIRLLYIDGNHDYEHKTNDIINYGKMLVSKGWIFVHDYFASGIDDAGGSAEETQMAVNELIKDSNMYTDFDVIGTLAMAKKV